MFTKADFERNEDNNYHTENGVEMAKHFGTKEEQELMAQIAKDHYARGHINPDEIEARNGIVKKYFHMLESETTNEADDLYHNNVKKVGQKDYNDYKGIQIHNLEKELKKVRQIILNLQDIENRDNSSDMVNDIRNMLGGYQDLLDSMESAFDKLRIGRHRKETTNEVADHGSTEYYRDLDKGQLNHTKSMLMKSAGQLKVAIEQRHKFGKELMGTGDTAGTGDLYKMLDTLNELIEKWDEHTKLYGM